MDTTEFYRAFSGAEGVYRAARVMRSEGFSLAQARWVLLTRYSHPLVKKVVYYGRARNERALPEQM